METLLQILTNLGLCTVGMIAFTLWQTRKHMHDFSLKILISHNRFFWIWVSVAQTLLAVLLGFYPALEIAVADLAINILQSAASAVGLQIEVPKELIKVVFYLTLVLLLSRLTNIAMRPEDKIGKNKQQATTDPTKPGGPKT
jgi:hypothetical protein